MSEVLKNQPEDVQRLYEIYYKDYPKLKDNKFFRIEKVSDNVFSVSLDGVNIENFDDKNGETLLVPDYLRDKDYAEYNGQKIKLDGFQNALKLGGYKEVYNEQTKTYEMYKKTVTNGNEGYKKIDNFSEAYYKAWVDIDWHFDRVFIETVLGGYNGEFFKFKPDVIKSYLDKGCIRLKEIILMKKQGQIDEKMYQDAVKYFKDGLLVKQLGDDGFYKSLRTNPAKKMTYEDWLEELTEYKNEGIITEKQFKACKNQLDELKEKGKIRLKDINEAKDHAQNDLLKLKTGIA